MRPNHFFVISSLAVLAACSAGSPPDAPILTGADDTVATAEDGVTGTIPVGSVLETTTDVNFRKGPGTSYSVIRVLPQGAQVTSVNKETATNNFRNVEHQGTTGWVHGKYLVVTSIPEGTGDPPPSTTTGRQEILDRAKASVGFSYWWGHGRWRPEGPTSSTKGSCAGSCPNCSHGGSYGADCSGMVAKAWNVGDNADLTVDEHPFSTVSFNGSNAAWANINRASLQPADALVYNNGSSGHIVLYEKGDGWGDMWLYECRGCSYGCVHNLRSLSSTYKGIVKK